MGKHKKKSSTFAEPVDATKLCPRDIGREITVMGRDITLGVHEAPMVQLTGQLDSLRANATRVVLTMQIKHPKLSFSRPRVIEVVGQ